MVFGTGTYVRLYAVNCYDVPSFDFLLHKYCKSGVTVKNQHGFVVKSAGFWPVIFPGSIQLCSCRDVVMDHHKIRIN